ncbi:hypothetical protein CF319_g8875 [Tilletia indica]|nr:hypothetical protein CF319_g8875 [Tilletia indica]
MSSASFRAGTINVAVAAAAAVLVPDDPTSLGSATSAPHTATRMLMSLPDFLGYFRLQPHEFTAIHTALRLPTSIETTTRDQCESKTCLLLLLAFLGGARLSTLARTFRRSEGSCSRIIQATATAIDDQWSSLLDITSAHNHILTPSRLRQYANVAEKQGCPLKGVWGFIDGTVRPIARPTRGQRNFYSGHKRIHGIKFQVVVALDGLVWIHGPHEGRRNDAFVLADSGLHNWLDEHSADPEGKDLFLYGDKAYAPRGHLVVPYKGLFVTKDQKRFNYQMSTHRIAVEWAIGAVPTMFPRFEIKRLQRSLQGNLPQLYRCAVVIRNAVSCISGNLTSQHVRCNPPSLAQYLDPSFMSR